MDILTKIITQRKKRIGEKGYTMGISLPETRDVPLNTFVTDPFLICEVKRKSPSKGTISGDLDAKKQAELYYSKGVRSVSVLTEEDYFAGSLTDLREVKKTFPGLAVLRKDFLLAEEDIDISYRAGADAVLLIAAILSGDELSRMYTKAKKYGMEALVEVHTKDDIDKAKEIRPELTGINCRDLTTFRTDLTIPLRVKQMIHWKTDLLFESGIHSREDARIALSSGFRGILVGEAVVRDPSLIAGLVSTFSLPPKNFWEKLYRRKRPFVKICGITGPEDAWHAKECGADILGFIFAPSTRQADPAILYELKECDILKAGVVVTKDGALDPAVKDLLDKGLIDTIQYHGDEAPGDCFAHAFPYYKVLQIKDKADIEKIKRYHSPRVLIDAFSPHKRGGIGHVIPEELISMAKEHMPLWLAGGMGPDNVKEMIEHFSPELIDAASKLEKSPGIKDHVKVADFITLIKG